MRFQSTKFVTIETIGKAKPGQWVQFESGQRGQYLGTTAAGILCIRWQNGKFGSTGNSAKIDAINNGLLRQYAKNSGSK